MLGVFLLPAFTRLGHECQDLLSPCDGMHVCTDYTSVYTLIRKSWGFFGRGGGGGWRGWEGGDGGGGGGVESEPMSTPREKSRLPGKKISSKEDRTCDAASSRPVSPTHYQRAIPAPGKPCKGRCLGIVFCPVIPESCDPDLIQGHFHLAPLPCEQPRGCFHPFPIFAASI